MAISTFVAYRQALPWVGLSLIAIGGTLTLVATATFVVIATRDYINYQRYGISWLTQH